MSEDGRTIATDSTHQSLLARPLTCRWSLSARAARCLHATLCTSAVTFRTFYWPAFKGAVTQIPAEGDRLLKEGIRLVDGDLARGERSMAWGSRTRSVISLPMLGGFLSPVSSKNTRTKVCRLAWQNTRSHVFRESHRGSSSRHPLCLQLVWFSSSVVMAKTVKL